MGDGGGVAGVGVMRIMSGRCEVCDGTGAVGAEVMGGRVRSSFKRKNIFKKIFLSKKYLKK